MTRALVLAVALIAAFLPDLSSAQFVWRGLSPLPNSPDVPTVVAGSLMPSAAPYYGASGSWAPLVAGATYTASDGHNETLPAQEQGVSTQAGYGDPAMAGWANPVLGSEWDTGAVMPCVYAAHPSGVAKVGFVLDEGHVAWTSVADSQPAIVGGTLVKLYCATVAASTLSDAQHEARAIVVPNAGYVTILQSQRNVAGTNGSPNFTDAGHPFELGKPVMVTSTTDTALTAGKVYCVWGPTTSTFGPNSYQLQGPTPEFTATPTANYACPTYMPTSGSAPYLPVNGSFSAIINNGSGSSGNILTVSGSNLQGSVQAGAVVTGTGVPSNTTIAAFGTGGTTGTGGAGTYQISNSALISSETMTSILPPVVSAGGTSTIVPVGAGTLLESTQLHSGNSQTVSESNFFLTDANGLVNEHVAYVSTFDGTTDPLNAHCGDIALGSKNAAQVSPCDAIGNALAELSPAMNFNSAATLTNDSTGCLAISVASGSSTKPYNVGDAIVWGAYASGGDHDPGYGDGTTGQPAANILQTFRTYYVTKVTSNATLHIERIPTHNDANCIPYSSAAQDTYHGMGPDLSFSTLYLQCQGTCPASAAASFTLQEMGGNEISYSGEGYLTITPDVGVPTGNVPLARTTSAAYGLYSLATHYKNVAKKPATFTVTTCGNAAPCSGYGSTTGLNQGGASAGSPAGTQNILTVTGYGPIVSSVTWAPVDTGGCVSIGNTQSQGTSLTSPMYIEATAVTAGVSGTSPPQITLGGNDAQNATIGNVVYNGGLWANCPDGTQITFATTLAGQERKMWDDQVTAVGSPGGIGNIIANWPPPYGGYYAHTNSTATNDQVADELASLSENVAVDNVATCIERSHLVLHSQCDDIDTNANVFLATDQAFGATGTGSSGPALSFATGTLPASISRNWEITAPLGGSCPTIVTGASKANYFVQSIAYNVGGHDIVTLNSGIPNTTVCPRGTLVVVENEAHTDYDFQNINTSYTMSMIDDAECGANVNAPSCGATSAIFSQSSFMIGYLRKHITIASTAWPTWGPGTAYYDSSPITYGILDNIVGVVPTTPAGATGAYAYFRSSVPNWQYTDVWLDNDTFNYTIFGGAGNLTLTNVTFNDVNFGSSIGGLTATTPVFSDVTVTNSTCPAGDWTAFGTLKGLSSGQLIVTRGSC